MSINPFDEQLQVAEQEAAALDAALHKAMQAIDWFEGINLDTLLDQLDKLRSDTAGLSGERHYIDAQVLQLEDEIRLVSESIGPLWNPANWFGSQQVVSRARMKELKASHRWMRGRVSEVESCLGDFRRREKDKEAEIERYRGFDLGARTDERSDLERRVVQQKKRVEETYSRKLHVDAALEPILNQIREIDRKASQLALAMERAQQLEDDLSSAANSYERAMIHQDCEIHFESGSPRTVMYRLEREIRRLDRDREKLQTRAANVAKRATRDVQRLIVDGSNLCHEGDEFIGLDALEVLVPVLAGSYDAVVVFDASITEALSSSAEDVRDALGGSAKIHIVAPGIDADETVLDLAGSDKTTFVVSNDRFAEFREKPAVRDGRLIRHEIVGGRVMIHDLEISEPYRR